MAFYVTPDFKLYDTTNEFEKKTEEQQRDILYDARDNWEKQNGQWEGDDPFPEVIVGKIDAKKTYGRLY